MCIVMKRRRFLGVGIVSAVGIAIGSYISFSSFEELIKGIIGEDTKSLHISEKVVDDFLIAARSEHAWDKFPFFGSFSKEEFVKWGYRLSNPIFNLPYQTKLDVYRSEIVGLFLLSTNFFQNKMDTTKPIRFMRIYNPYFSPCANPFSNSYYPSPS